jgi:hypothetical protein
MNYSIILVSIVIYVLINRKTIKEKENFIII